MTLAILAVRLERLAPWLLFSLVFATAAWASQPYAVGVFHDDGVYVVLGKALASGEGYRYLNLPGAPTATHYHPGYPLLVVAVEAEQVVYLFTGRRALPPQSFTATEYVIPTPLSVTTRSLQRVLADYPVTVVATAVPAVHRSAQLLADSAGSLSGAHLVPLQTFSDGGAFRVERRGQPISRP